MKRHFPSLTPFRGIVGLVFVIVVLLAFLAVAGSSDAQLASVSGNGKAIDTSKLPESLRQRIDADRENGSVPVDINSLPKARPEGGAIIYGYDYLRNKLVTFDAANPATFLSEIDLIGIDTNNNEALYGIDFRPADGGLYGIASRGFPRSARIVRIDTTTGQVTSVHPSNTAASLVDSFLGFDFHPNDDLIRNVGRERANRRLSPVTGLATAVDLPLSYAAGDVNAGVTPRIVHNAHTITTGSPSSTLFAIDSEANSLVRIGGVNGDPSPNGGILTTIGPLGFDFTNFGGMDIPVGSNFAYASLNINSIPHLVQIELATGAGLIIGEIGSGDRVIDGLAIPPGPFALPSPSPTQTPVPSPTPTATPTPTPTPTPTATPTPAPISIIRAENAAGLPGEIATVPIDLVSLGNESSISFSVNFDPTKLQLRTIGLGNGAPLGAILTSDVSQAASGRLGISITSGVPYSVGPRRLALVVFDVIPGALYISTPITFGGIPTTQNVADITGASLPVAFQAGRVIVGFTAAGVDVSGRVLTADGRGLRNARVVLTDAGGTRRVVTTSSFGHYRFTDVEAGGSYVISVSSNRYTFASRLVQVVDTLDDVNFVAN